MAKVMVTGASSGLGAAIAKQFASRGDRMIIVARRESLLQELQAELLALGAPSAEYKVVDLADAEQVKNLADELPNLGIDVLINNAALGHWDYTWDTTPEVMRSMVALNVSAVAVLTAAFSQQRHQKSARLMNVASGAGYALFEGAIPYSATKFLSLHSLKVLLWSLLAKNRQCAHNCSHQDQLQRNSAFTQCAAQKWSDWKVTMKELGFIPQKKSPNLRCNSMTAMPSLAQ